MDKKEAIRILKEKFEEIDKLLKLPPLSTQYYLWRNSVEDVLEAAFGRDSTEYKRFHEISGKISAADRQGSYHGLLRSRAIAIKSIINKYEELGAEEKPTTPAEFPPKAFIAHEGETRALTMLKEFLEALGIQYFIAESKASDGRSIEKQVDWTQSKADFAICLVTKGKAINKKTGKHYMAPNIADELGRARQVFGNKIILLVQKGVEPHTNIKEIVHETFTTTNMENAFIKIAKELRNWGFIRVGKA